MKRPLESDYTSHVAYTRALEAYCDSLAQDEEWTPDDMAYRPGGSAQPEQGTLMTKDDALKLAQKAMENSNSTSYEMLHAIVAIKEALAQPEQEALYGMNQDDWKDVVAAITKVRDGRGIYLACRPADVFQDWFLALGTAKVKEKNT